MIHQAILFSRSTAHAVVPFARWCHQANKSSSISSACSKLFSLKTYHKRLCDKPQERAKCRGLEREAWRELQTVTDEAMEASSAVELTELLTTWTYFSKYWENGMDGPSASTAHPDSQAPTPPLHVPPATRDTATPSRPRRGTGENIALPPRANPLDEVLDF